MDFTNKVVLVTGASAGIGEATALLLAAHGARLALVGRDEANLREVGRRCQQARGLEPLLLLADLGTDAGVERVAQDTIQHFGRLDVLINNAGISTRAVIEHTDMEAFDRVFNLNVRGVYNLTRLLVPDLIKTKGNIVNVSSISGSAVALGSLPYGMSKAALDHFSNLIALELAPKGVRVNTVSPGITVTKIVQRVTGYSDEQYEAFLRETETVIPMGRVCESEDVAKMIAHLASDESALVTGAIVPVDGGLRFTAAGLGSTMKKQMNTKQ